MRMPLEKKNSKILCTRGYSKKIILYLVSKKCCTPSHTKFLIFFFFCGIRKKILHMITNFEVCVALIFFFFFLVNDKKANDLRQTYRHTYILPLVVLSAALQQKRTISSINWIWQLKYYILQLFSSFSLLHSAARSDTAKNPTSTVMMDQAASLFLRLMISWTPKRPVVRSW